MRCSIVFVLMMVIGSSHQTLYSCDPNASCGCSRNSASVNRIVGGEDASDGTWNWAVYISIDESKLCGGSILSSSWILTAAHCVNEANASQVTVYAGAIHQSPSLQSSVVSQTIVHQDYDTTTFVNDIALLQLSTPLVMADSHVNVICLPSVEKATLATDEWPPANVSVSTNSNDGSFHSLIS